MNILDRRFEYRDSASTNIADTWRKHGFRPTTDEERAARQVRTPEVTQQSRPTLRLTVKK